MNVAQRESAQMVGGMSLAHARTPQSTAKSQLHFIKIQIVFRCSSPGPRVLCLFSMRDKQPAKSKKDCHTKVGNAHGRT